MKKLLLVAVLGLGLFAAPASAQVTPELRAEVRSQATRTLAYYGAENGTSTYLPTTAKLKGIQLEGDKRLVKFSGVQMNGNGDSWKTVALGWSQSGGVNCGREGQDGCLVVECAARYSQEDSFRDPIDVAAYRAIMKVRRPFACPVGLPPIKVAPNVCPGNTPIKDNDCSRLLLDRGVNAEALVVAYAKQECGKGGWRIDLPPIKNGWRNPHFYADGHSGEVYCERWRYYPGSKVKQINGCYIGFTANHSFLIGPAKPMRGHEPVCESNPRARPLTAQEPGRFKRGDRYRIRVAVRKYARIEGWEVRRGAYVEISPPTKSGDGATVYGAALLDARKDGFIQCEVGYLVQPGFAPIIYGLGSENTLENAPSCGPAEDRR
jgi:hypothetical protein